MSDQYLKMVNGEVMPMTADEIAYAQALAAQPAPDDPAVLRKSSPVTRDQFDTLVSELNGLRRLVAEINAERKGEANARSRPRK